MKKATKFLATLMTVTIVASLTACGSSSSSDSTDDSSAETTEAADDSADAEDADTEDADAADTEAEGGDYKIGIAIPTEQEEIWTHHKEELTAAVESYGCEAVVQVANGDSDKQNAQIENMLTEGIDLLILAACDPGAASNMVKECVDEGVPVIGYDRVNAGDGYSLYLCFDNVKVGEMQAQAAVEVAPKGNYILLQGDMVNQPATNEIQEGMYNVLQEYIDKGDITVVTDLNCKNWAADEGLANCENGLTAANNDVAAVLCANDGICGGAVQALESAGLAGKTWTSGQDCEVAAVQRIIAGTQSMTEYKSPTQLAQAAVDAAMQILNGEEPETTGMYEDVPMFTVDPIAITADNYQEELIDTGVMTEDDLKATE